MRSTTILGLVVLFLLLAAMFTGLYYAYGDVGKAVKLAEERKIIVPCSEESPCKQGQCVEGYCRES